MGMKKLRIQRFISMVVMIIVSTVSAYAQEKDTMNVVVETQVSDTIHVAEDAVLTVADSLVIDKTLGKAAKQKRDWATWKPDPKRAMWLSIVLPGAGQIYNRKYWKLPIVYGGFLGCAYAMRWNNQMYADYSQAYIDIMDDNPETKSYEEFLHLGSKITPQNIERYKSLFKSRKDRYRRWRDLSFFCMLGVYAISIIDAYVDASLSQFDISDDLSLHLGPGFVSSGSMSSSSSHSTPNPLRSTGLGINASLNF